MWLQRFTNYLLQHRWQTIALTFAVTFIYFLGAIGILIAALITLRKGVIEGAILAVAASLPYLISVFIPGHFEVIHPLAIWVGVGVAVLSNLLTWVLAVMLQRQASWSLVLQIAALTGVLVISVIHLAYPGEAEWWGSQLKSYYAQVSTMSSALKKPVLGSVDQQAEAINVIKQYVTGIIVTFILSIAVMQLIIARWWEAVVFNPGSLRPELHGIRLSRLAGVLFILSLVLSYLGNSVVLDIMPVLYMLFCVAGLSLIHYLFGLMNASSTLFWLAMFYIILFVSLPTSIVLVAFLALFDVWLDVRKRFKKI